MKAKQFVRLIAASLVLAGPMASSGTAGPPLHYVHGQGVVQLSPPDGGIFTVSILAWEDETGVHGVATWLNEFPTIGDPDLSGWQWVIDVDTLSMLSDNEASVGGIIVQDNKFPWIEGNRILIRRVQDNGQGANDPPDKLFGVPILGDNFSVR